MVSKEELKQLVGKRIKSIREDRNISQQELAALCEIEKGNFSRIESGNTNPTLFTLYKIAYHLNVNLSSLTDLTPSE